MDKTTLRAIQLLTSLLLGDRDPAVIPYTPAKTEIPPIASPYFKRRSASKCGISPVRINAFLAELEAHKSINPHAVMILKDGFVIAEAYAPGFERGMPHLSHSMSKTVTAIAVAILADEEKLNTGTSLAEIFTDFDLPSDTGAITVGDLVTMSSGKSFSEVGVVTSESWLYDFLASDDRFEHGEGFRYNSMNSYLLACIIERLSGESFANFVKTRLFDPLGIRAYLWEKGPEGTEKGGWGLYLALEDWLKIATLFITGGKFEDKIIVSHMSMLEILLTRNPHSANDNDDFDYAGHINMHKRSGILLFNGLFGQDVYIDPVSHLAVAVNCGSSELFKSGRTVGTILKYFPPEINDKRLGVLDSWRLSRALKKRIRFFCHTGGFICTKPKRDIFTPLVHSRAVMSEWDTVLGKYDMPMNNLSVLPIIPRLMQNNLVGGIDSFELARISDGILLRLKIADTVMKIPAGIGAYKDATVDIFGEKYRIRSAAKAERDGDGIIYKLAIKFPELPNERYIAMRSLGHGTLNITFSETPGLDTVLPLFERIGEGSTLASFAMSMLEKKLGEGFLEKRMSELFCVSFLAPQERSKDHERILDEENTRITEERKQLLNAPFISKFIRTVELYEECEGEEPERHRGFLRRLAGLFSSKKAAPETDTLSESQSLEDAPIEQ